MPFDISTAKPVEEETGGFDLSTATPAAAIEPEIRDFTSDMPVYEKVAAGAGKAIYDVGRGVGQRLGLVSPQEIAEARALDEPLMRTGAGVAGNVLGNIGMAVPIAMAAPATGTVAGSMALGGAFGAARPTVEGESVARNIAEGAAYGLGGALIPRGAARLISPQAAATQAEALGKLTPGQALGGAFKTAEEKASSLPLAGPMIAKAQRESVQSWNTGVLNKVLEPIGEKTDKFGHAGVEETANKLSKAYNDILPKLRVEVDNKFEAEMNSLRQMTSSLAEPQQKQFEKILGPDGLGRKITKYGKMSGESMKEVDSDLGRLSRLYSKADDPDKQQLGDALREAQASLRSLVERSNPQYSDRLKNINNGWARLVRVENAAAKTGAKEGVFTPAQLNQAVRATDASLRHRKFAHGKALFQDIATQAEKTIGNAYPDSGSAGRLMLHPVAAVSTLPVDLPLAAAYAHPAVRSALSSAFTARPEGAGRLAEALRAKAAMTGRAGAVAGQALQPEEATTDESQQ